jgi:hypothetical protein
MSEHVAIDDLRLELSKRKWAGEVADISGTDLYGLKNCRVTWGELLSKRLIFNAIDCTRADTLNQVEVDCLIGKLSENLAKNCC